MCKGKRPRQHVHSTRPRAGATPFHRMLEDVLAYWNHKRNKLRKKLLRVRGICGPVPPRPPPPQRDLRLCV